MIEGGTLKCSGQYPNLNYEQTTYHSRSSRERERERAHEHHTENQGRGKLRRNVGIKIMRKSPPVRVNPDRIGFIRRSRQFLTK